MPWQMSRSNFLIRFATLFFNPLTYHTLMQRVNLHQHQADAFIKSWLDGARIAYP